MKSRNGFTLIEILVVIALIALIMSVAVPNFNLALKVNISKTSRELATTIKSTYDEAILKGTVHRIAFDLNQNEYWVEVGPKDYLMKNLEQVEAERRKLDRMTEEEKKAYLKEPFVLAKNLTSKKISLPTGVKFLDVINSRTKEPQTEGVVYAHVFPHGFVEKLIIHITDRFDRKHTLFVNSVTGKSRFFERYIKDETEVN
jgi:prepilin-type N-terminal cleavage/methylation domain-containing protein